MSGRDSSSGVGGGADAAGVEIRDLSVDLGDATVLDSVSASVDPGQFVGLVGPNGAGKTTLLRTMTGVLSPDAGSVRVGGERVAALSSRETSRRVAVVPQDTTLSFDFSVRDVVAMGRHPHQSRFGGPTERDRDAVDAALDRTETTDLADRPITEVSGGERQRVVLARALAQDAPVLLLDEPTASLDINHQVRTLELVRDLADDGRTVVAAIHDLNLAAHYCDELLLLSDGDVRAAGEPADVLSEDHLEAAFDTSAVVTRHPVTGSTYVTALPAASGRPGGPGEDGASDSPGRVHVIGGGGTVSRLLYLLSAAGYEVTVGVLNEGDSDLETARSLGLDAVTEEPFAPVREDAREAVEDHIEAADATVLADVEVGAGNLPNLRAARAADAPVVVEERPFAERNYAGSDAAVLYEDLCERGVVVEPDGLLDAVSEVVGGEMESSVEAE